MSEPTNTPASRDDCDHARRAIARFVGAAANRGQGRAEPGGWDEARFRAHLLECADCMRSYRAQLAAAAHMGRELRQERTERLRTLRHAEFHRRAIESTARGKRRNRFGLRLALIPGLFALLLILFRQAGGTEGLVVHWEGGEVHAAGQLLNEDRPVMRLVPGDWCRTRGNAVVTLGDGIEPGPEPCFRLGAETDVLVLDPRDHGLRLERGSLGARGPARLFTPYGVLELSPDAEVELRVDAGGGELRVLAGTVERTGPSGREELGPGPPVALLAG